jgi:hypothetical protein
MSGSGKSEMEIPVKIFGTVLHFNRAIRLAERAEPLSLPRSSHAYQAKPCADPGWSVHYE